MTDVFPFTNRKVVAGLALLGIAGIFLGLSLLFYWNYADMASKINQGEYTMCDHCPLAMEVWLNDSRLYGVIGSVIGAFGAALLIAGYKSFSLIALKG